MASSCKKSNLLGLFWVVLSYELLSNVLYTLTWLNRLLILTLVYAALLLGKRKPEDDLETKLKQETIQEEGRILRNRLVL